MSPRSIFSVYKQCSAVTIGAKLENENNLANSPYQKNKQYTWQTMEALYYGYTNQPIIMLQRQKTPSPLPPFFPQQSN